MTMVRLGPGEMGDKGLMKPFHLRCISQASIKSFKDQLRVIIVSLIGLSEFRALVT